MPIPSEAGRRKLGLRAATYVEEFEPVIDKIELCALPEAIYRAYKAVLPKAKRKFLEKLEQEDSK